MNIKLYKTAIDYAKEKDYKNIVNLLSKKLITGNERDIEYERNIEYKRDIDYKRDIEYKRDIDYKRDIEYERMQKENESLRIKNIQLEQKNSQIIIENELLKKFLLAVKEKSRDIKFFDFDDYEEESVIGNGATSIVKIICKKKPDKYAIKELKEFDHKTMQRFITECEILFKLSHPCIVRIIGFNYGNEAHAPSIILSLEPKSLETAIQNKELDHAHKNRITVELVLGMRYIHHHNFMHRDLKPSNILLSKNNHVRISDFGLAKENDLETSQSKGIGTLRFMAPELFEDSESSTKYTNKVDVYSFGITLIYIITDKYPGFNMKNVVLGILPRLPNTITNWIRELILQCLSMSPEKRPTFCEIFEIMKSNNYDMFDDTKGKKLTIQQENMKKSIDSRVLKIEAFEFQQQT